MDVAYEPKLTLKERCDAVRPHLDARERLPSEQHGSVGGEDGDVVEDSRVAIVECDARRDAARYVQCPGIEFQVESDDLDRNRRGRRRLTRRRLAQRATNGDRESEDKH